MTTSDPDLAEFESKTRRLEHEQLRRIQQAFNRMPFGGNANFAYPDRDPGGSGVLTLEQIADNLDRLCDALSEVVDEHNVELEELGKHRRLASAIREVASLFTSDGST